MRPQLFWFTTGLNILENLLRCCSGFGTLSVRVDRTADEQIMEHRYHNVINGQLTEATSGRRFNNINPADTTDLVGSFPASGEAEVNAAVDAAADALPGWRKLPAPRRGEIVFRVGRIMADRKEQIAQLLTREMGKVIAEARGDVQEGIDTAYYAAGEGRRMFGDTVPVEMPNKAGFSIRRPIGVCGMITPWNFPMAIPTWKIFPAIMAGNTVVLKPATDAPATVTQLLEVLAEAGLPEGVVNLVTGSGAAVGDVMVRHPGIGAISFTGSSAVGAEIAATCGQLHKRVSLEMGGKNAQIVMDDADLDLALEGALWGAFGTAGQRCTATSRLIVHKKVLLAFTDRLVERTSRLKLGDGRDESVDVGPLINAAQRETVAGWVDRGRSEGARMLCGGKPAAGNGLDKGHFYEPTLFDCVEPDMSIAQEEIFGPVTAILAVDSLDEAIAVLNGTRYGLSSSIYTRNVNGAFKAMEEIEAGITYVNGPTIGAEVQLPFGGVKATGNGHREASHTVFDFYTEWKSVYVDYSGKLQRAQIDET